MKQLLELAKSCGFTNAGNFAPRELVFYEEVRQMCAAGRCHNFGKSWSCPPGCGTLEEGQALARTFSRGLLVQTTGKLEDDYDLEGMMQTEQEHKAHFEMLVKHLREQKLPMLPMGAGGCRVCKTCSYPDAPCRFPEKMFVSMEAYGLWVSKVCEQSGLPYYYGPGTMTYVSCILYNAAEETDSAES